MTHDLAQAQPQQQIAQSAQMSMTELLHHVSLVQNVMKNVMHDKEHYGIVPGCQKPSLWKAGAEKLLLAFRLTPKYGYDAVQEGEHYSATVRCTLIARDGTVVAEGLGSCSTREKKYAMRKQGDKWIPNEYLADQYNTVLKMACKRALIAATLNATAASDIFTQDLEDLEEATAAAENRPPVARPQAKPAAPGAAAPPPGGPAATPKATEAVQAPPEPAQEAAPGVQPSSPPCSEAQRKLIYARWKDSGIPEADFMGFIRDGGCQRIDDIPKAAVNTVLTWLDENRK